MKFKVTLLILLFSVFGFSQTETTGKINTVIMSKYELGYALYKPANTKEKKPLIVFISGDGEKGTDIENGNIPTRIYHGLLDDVVNVDYAITIYKEIKKCNAKDVELTIFDDAGHNSWTRVYVNQEIYDWMLKQKKTNTNK